MFLIKIIRVIKVFKFKKYNLDTYEIYLCITPHFLPTTGLSEIFALI